MAAGMPVNILPNENTKLVSFVWLRFASVVCDQALAFAVPVLVLMSTGSVSAAGVVFFIQWLPRVLGTGFFGYIVDSFDLRHLFLIADLSRAALCVCMVLIDDLIGLALCAAAIMFVSGFASLCMEGVIARSPGTLLEAAQAHYQSSMQLATICGPFVGGIILAATGKVSLICAIAIIFVISSLTSLALSKQAGNPRRSSALSLHAYRKSVADGFRIVSKSPHLVRLVSIGFLINLIGGYALAIIPVMVISVYGGGEAETGIVTAFASALSLIVAVVLTRGIHNGKISTQRGIVGCVIILLMSALLMVVAPGMVVFTSGLSVWAAGMTFFSVWLRTIRLRYVAAAEVGSAMSVFMMIILIPTPIAGLLVAVAGAIGNPQGVMAILIGLVAAVLFFTMRSFRRIEQ